MKNQNLSSHDKYILFSILLLSFLLKLILAFTLNTDLKSDSVTYNNLALSVLSGEYSIDGRPTAFVVCGYPFFLSLVYYLFGEGQFYVRLIQSMLEIITGYLFFRISLKFFNAKFALISLALFSFLPSNLLFSQAILTESLFGLFAMAVLYFCLGEFNPGRIFFTGIFFGFAILVRSSFLIAVLLVPLYLFYERKNLFAGKQISGVIKYSLIFITGLFITLAPWMIRNKIVMNSFTLATQGGSVLWEGNNPDATGTWNADAVNSNPLFENPDEVYREKEFYKTASAYIFNNPLKFLMLGIKKTGYLFSSERMAILYFMNSEPGQTSTQVYKSVSPLILITVNIPYFIIILFGTWGLLALNDKSFFIYGFILMWMATVYILVGLARYHYVLIPFFILGAVNFLIERKNFLKKITLPKKSIGFGFSFFLIGVWTTEFYLMIK